VKHSFVTYTNQLTF